MLVVQVPVGLGDRVGIEQPVLSALARQLRSVREQTFSLDPAIHHHVTDVDVAGPVFPGEALR